MYVHLHTYSTVVKCWIYQRKESLSNRTASSGRQHSSQRGCLSSEFLFDIWHINPLIFCLNSSFFEVYDVQKPRLDCIVLFQLFKPVVSYSCICYSSITFSLAPSLTISLNITVFPWLQMTKGLIRKLKATNDTSWTWKSVQKELLPHKLGVGSKCTNNIKYVVVHEYDEKRSYSAC